MNDTEERAASIREIAALAKRGCEAIGSTLKWDDAPVGLPKTIPVRMVPGEYPDFKSVKALFEEYRQQPERKTGTAKVLTLQSFTDLVNRHKIDATAIFANSDWHKPSVTAVVDYHDNAANGTPAFLKHRVVYEFPLSEPWKLWVGQDNKPMDQAEFASFIEDNIADLSSPEAGEAEFYERTFGTKLATPAELIQLSRGLQVFASVEVKNATTLQTGEGSITFNEEHRDANGNKLTVPGLFILQIAPFFMSGLIRVPVRLRYRVSGSAIKWAFKIYRPDLAVTDRVRTDLDIIRRDTDLPVFEGFPENNSPN